MGVKITNRISESTRQIHSQKSYILVRFSAKVFQRIVKFQIFACFFFLFVGVKVSNDISERIHQICSQKSSILLGGLLPKLLKE